MPWSLNDYPASMRNLEHATKKKAIDIANAMVDEGHDEGRAIPIAMEQAKEWERNASQNEIDRYEKNGKPSERSEKGKIHKNNPERLEEGEHVVAHENGWAVRSSGARRASDVYDTKAEAIKRAKEIAENKGTYLTIFKQNGFVQEKLSYESKS